ncbi:MULTISPECIES: winged helix-turn-helix domain-containing protein [Bacteroides]|uniref:winged helix-turn-helix domain-containing protein n=1 Tax=Bacteroides TaxID=816 RepID=UPI0011C14969|nr:MULTISPECIES: winged helix-turn-helix domain-containing protein [Bacteroides]
MKLTSMPAKLLQGFLEAEKRRLSVNEIIELLWSGDAVDIARVYTIIKRLRKDLITLSDWKIMNENDSYQLKNPHSIEE